MTGGGTLNLNSGKFTQSPGTSVVAATVKVEMASGVATYDQLGGTVTSTNFNIGDTAARTGIYNLSGGSVSVSGVSSSGRIGFTGIGTVNQSAGTTFSNSGGSGFQGAMPDAGDPAMIVAKRGTGTWNLNGGLFELTNTSYGTLFMGSISLSDPNANGTFNQAGGTVNLAITRTIEGAGGAPGALAIGPGSQAGVQLYAITGGTLDASSASVNYAGSAGGPGVGTAGTLRITGAAADINLSSANVGNELMFYVGSGGTLDAEFNSASFSTIDVFAATGGSGAKTAAFASGSKFKVGFDSYTPIGSMTWNVLTASSITDLGLMFDNSGDTNWTYSIVSGGRGQILQATYVPEPTVFGILGIGAAGLLTGRRRRA